MSADANKKLVQQVYADSASRSGTTFADNLAEDAVLRGRPSGEERCDNCLYYLNPDEKISYCWHPKLRVLVGDQWWCQWWEKTEG